MLKRLRRPDGRRAQGMLRGFVCSGGRGGGGLGERIGWLPIHSSFPGTLRVAAVILVYKSMAKPCGPVPENSWELRSRVSSGCRLCGCWLHLWDAWDPGSSLVLRDLPAKPHLTDRKPELGKTPAHRWPRAQLSWDLSVHSTFFCPTLRDWERLHL